MPVPRAPDGACPRRTRCSEAESVGFMAASEAVIRDRQVGVEPGQIAPIAAPAEHRTATRRDLPITVLKGVPLPDVGCQAESRRRYRSDE